VVIVEGDSQRQQESWGSVQKQVSTHFLIEQACSGIAAGIELS
jgi:hypothetical protein